MRVLMVCLGNICRSPIAEAVLRSAAAEAGKVVEVDSAGTANYHIGKGADPRGIAAGGDAGYDVTSVARQVTAQDFNSFDLLVAMDGANRHDLLALAPDADARSKVRLFRDFAGEDGQDVPDPYYGDADGFARVVEICERAAAGLVQAAGNAEF